MRKHRKALLALPLLSNAHIFQYSYFSEAVAYVVVEGEVGCVDAAEAGDVVGLMIAYGAGEEEMDAGVPAHSEGADDLDLKAGYQFAPTVGAELGGIVGEDTVGVPVVVVEIDAGEAVLLEADTEAETCEEGIVAVAAFAEGVDVDAEAGESALAVVGAARCDIVREAVTEFDRGVELIEEIGIDGYLILLALCAGRSEGVDGVAYIELDVHTLIHGGVGVFAFGECGEAEEKEEKTPPCPLSKGVVG